jgi:hypothetical protein
MGFVPDNQRARVRDGAGNHQTSRNHRHARAVAISVAEYADRGTAIAAA